MVFSAGKSAGSVERPPGAWRGWVFTSSPPRVDPHERPVGAGLDVLADQVAGHRVKGRGHLYVVVPVDLGRWRRRVGRRGTTGAGNRAVAPPRSAKYFAGRRAVVPCTRSRRWSPAPLLGLPLRVGQVDEALAGEERARDEGDNALDPRLVGRLRTRAGQQEAPGLGVLDKGLVEPGLCRVGLFDDAGHVVGDRRP